MAKVGRFVTDPKAGAYCPMILDSGETTPVMWGASVGEVKTRCHAWMPIRQAGGRHSPASVNHLVPWSRV